MEARLAPSVATEFVAGRARVPILESTDQHVDIDSIRAWTRMTPSKTAPPSTRNRKTRVSNDSARVQLVSHPFETHFTSFKDPAHEAKSIGQKRDRNHIDDPFDEEFVPFNELSGEPIAIETLWSAQGFRRALANACIAWKSLNNTNRASSLRLRRCFSSPVETRDDNVLAWFRSMSLMYDVWQHIDT